MLRPTRSQLLWISVDTCSPHINTKRSLLCYFQCAVKKTQTFTQHNIHITFCFLCALDSCSPTPCPRESPSPAESLLLWSASVNSNCGKRLDQISHTLSWTSLVFMCENGLRVLVFFLARCDKVYWSLKHFSVHYDEEAWSGWLTWQLQYMDLSVDLSVKQNSVVYPCLALISISPLLFPPFLLLRIYHSWVPFLPLPFSVALCVTQFSL